MSTRHIVLTGAMGVGKTTIGVRLAKRLNVPFADSDAQLLDQQERTARQIAAENGVEHLHRLEHELASQAVLADLPQVFAAAASIADDPALLEEINQAGARLVYLEDDTPDLLLRSQTGSHRRPIDARLARELTQTRRSNAVAARAVMVSVTLKSPEEVVSLLLGSVDDG